MKKLKIGSYITLAIGAVSLILSLLIPYLIVKAYPSQPGTIGVIGGADTPTMLFLAWDDMSHLFFSGIILIIAALFCLIFAKSIVKYCTAETTVLSLLISLFTAAGLYCVSVWYSIVAFHEMSTATIAYPLSILCGIFCLSVFIILIIHYCKYRKKIFSVKGLIIDILTYIWFLPFFLLLFDSLYGLIS